MFPPIFGPSLYPLSLSGYVSTSNHPIGAIRLCHPSCFSISLISCPLSPTNYTWFLNFPIPTSPTPMAIWPSLLSSLFRHILTTLPHDNQLHSTVLTIMAFLQASSLHFCTGSYFHYDLPPSVPLHSFTHRPSLTSPDLGHPYLTLLASHFSTPFLRHSAFALFAFLTSTCHHPPSIAHSLSPTGGISSLLAHTASDRNTTPRAPAFVLTFSPTDLPLVHVSIGIFRHPSCSFQRSLHPDAQPFHIALQPAHSLERRHISPTLPGFLTQLARSSTNSPVLTF